MQLHQNIRKYVSRYFNIQVPLRLVLALPFVLQIFAAVGLTGYLSISNGRKAVNELASKLRSEVSARVDQHLASYLSAPKKINSATADAIESGLLKYDDLPGIGRFFWGKMQLFDVSYISYGLVKGGYAGAGITIEVEGKPISISETSAATGNVNKNFATDAKGNRTKLRLSIEDYDYRKEAWYVNATTNRKSGWSEIYAWDVDNAIAVSISNSKPIYDSKNNLIGAVGVDMLLLGISNFLQELKTSPNSRVFIIERNGMIVAKSDKEKFYKKVDKIDFIYEARNKLPVAIHADEKRLRQVLLNLLGNGIKFTDKGCVTLKIGVVEDNHCSNSTHRIRFQIEDTGIGIAPQQLEKIFLPFEQVGEKHRMVEGTGLGLTISKQIVEMMGSQLHVESAVDKGSTFWFEVELSEATQWVKSKSNSNSNIIGYEYKKQTQTEKIRILVIDDRWQNCSVIMNFLEPLGFAVIQAENGQEGLDKAITLLPDLIITDIAMPVINGLDMTKQLRFHPTTKTIPIIVSSASVFNFDRQQSRDAGANDFLPKPVDFHELLAQLQKYLHIDWVYEVVAPISSISSEQDEVTFTSPPIHELQTLYAAAKIGDIEGVETEALRIGQINSQYQPFVETILKFVYAMDDEAILKFIKPYIN